MLTKAFIGTLLEELSADAVVFFNTEVSLPSRRASSEKDHRGPRSTCNGYITASCVVSDHESNVEKLDTLSRCSRGYPVSTERWRVEQECATDCVTVPTH